MNEKVYKRLCALCKGREWRTPLSVLEFFVDRHIINIFEVDEYLDRYEKEELG